MVLMVVPLYESGDDAQGQCLLADMRRKQHGLCGQLWAREAAEVTEGNAGGCRLP